MHSSRLTENVQIEFADNWMLKTTQYLEIVNKGRSLAGIAGSNPGGGMNISLL